MLSNKLKFSLVTLLSIVVLTPIVVSVFKVKADPLSVPSSKRVTPPVTEAPTFVDDPAVLGSWTSVDFVNSIEEFVPGKKAWSGDLFLKGVVFEANGATSGPWRWSKGTLWHPGDESLANYTLKTVGGTPYLFVEWMSGDVIIRGEKPRYYVLSKGEFSEPPATRGTPVVAEAPAFVDDPPALGSWVSVDFVRSMDEFAPGTKSWVGGLVLKGIVFRANGETSGPWKWSKGSLWHPGDKTLAKYTIKMMDGSPYLFMEWMSGDVTIRGEKPWYYVMTRDPAVAPPQQQQSGVTPPQQQQMVQPAVLAKPQAAPPVDDRLVVGTWTSVDFVQDFPDFVPGKRSWQGDLYLKGLQFRSNGQTSGPWKWGGGVLWHPGDKTYSRYTVQNLNGRLYLFMEWMSGDVTIRGQKPWIYVMTRN